jgi:hypothetical protein
MLIQLGSAAQITGLSRVHALSRERNIKVEASTIGFIPSLIASAPLKIEAFGYTNLNDQAWIVQLCGGCAVGGAEA